jgi:hypothetical protein
LICSLHNFGSHKKVDSRIWVRRDGSAFLGIDMNHVARKKRNQRTQRKRQLARRSYQL